MPITRIEKFEDELRKEIQALWNDGSLQPLVQAICKYFSRPELYTKFGVNLNFDLVVHTDGGKKHHIVPLATIAPGMSVSPSVWREWSDAQKTRNLSKKRLLALRKRMDATQRFSGVSFGLIPRGKYTWKLRRIP